MPLIVKRKGDVLTTESKRHKTDSGAPGPSKKCYESLQRLSYVQDEWHTLVRIVPSSVDELRKMVAKYVGSFLNGKGGILVFGVSRTGFVYGDPINRKEEDNLRLTIDETFKKFKPMVRPDMYRITFTPVKERGENSHGDLQVVEIRVASGDRYELYQDEFHEAFQRRGCDAYGPLTPHEIKRHTLKQCTEKLIAEKRFVNLLHVKEDSNKIKEIEDNRKEEKNNGVEVGERNSSREKSQTRQQKADIESEKESKIATPVIKYPKGGKHDRVMRGAGRDCEEGMNKATAIDVDKLDTVSQDVLSHGRVAAKVNCPSEGVAKVSCPSEGIAKVNCPSEGVAKVNCPSEGIANVGCPSGGVAKVSCPSGGIAKVGCPSGGIAKVGCPSGGVAKVGCPSEGIAKVGCPSGDVAKVSCPSEGVTMPSTTRMLDPNRDDAAGTTTADYELRQAFLTGTEKKKEGGPVSTKLVYRNAVSSMEGSRTDSAPSRPGQGITPPGKVVPTTANDRALAIGQIDTGRSGVPLVKAVGAMKDTGKENRQICSMTSGGLAITVTATKLDSVHQVTPSSNKQLGVCQAAPWLSKQLGVSQATSQSGVYQTSPWLNKQPGVIQVAPWLNQQPGSFNIQNAQRLAVPAERPPLHNYSTHRSDIVGQHFGMNICTQIPAPRPSPYTLATPAIFYPSLRPPSYFH